MPPAVEGSKNDGSAAWITGSLGWMWPDRSEWDAAALRTSIACMVDMPTLDPRLRTRVLTMVPSVRCSGASVT